MRWVLNNGDCSLGRFPVTFSEYDCSLYLVLALERLFNYIGMHQLSGTQSHKYINKGPHG